MVFCSLILTKPNTNPIYGVWLIKDNTYISYVNKATMFMVVESVTYYLNHPMLSLVTIDLQIHKQNK